MEKVIENLNAICQKINALCVELNRSPEEIEILAASKFRTTETLKLLAADGRVTCFGENRVQEMLGKYDPSLTWDVIGQLQTNKVKYVIDKVRLIQSVDRLALAEEIERQAEKHDKIQKILVEVNSGNEDCKGGLRADEVVEFCEELKKFSHIECVGLMAVAPLCAEREILRACFTSVKSVFDKLAAQNPSFIKLSMGMSNDYLLAIECGSNCVRLGRILFE